MLVDEAIRLTSDHGFNQWSAVVHGQRGIAMIELNSIHPKRHFRGPRSPGRDARLWNGIGSSGDQRVANPGLCQSLTG